MSRRKSTWVVLVLGLALTFSAAAFAADWVIPGAPTADRAVWTMNNMTGIDATGLHLEFEQEVTILYKLEVGGLLAPVGEMTGMVFDFVGTLPNYGAVIFEWQPIDAVPALTMWMSGVQPIGTPYFTTVAKLGYLFGQGIVHVREANPLALQAAFDQFFLDNGEYLEGLSESLGMSLADSLMPIIMTSPAEGIENFFNTIVGMLGVTTLDGVLEGGIDFSALFNLLGL
jgi:hypothetical protein